MVALTLLTVFMGTAVSAVRCASRSRLVEALKRIDRPARIELFDAHDHAYALTALIYRQMGIVLFVIAMGAALPRSGAWYVSAGELVLVCAAWLLLVGTAIPAAWARYAGEAFLARILPCLEVLRIINRPILMVTRTVDEIVRRMAGAPRSTASRPDAVEREVLDALSHGEVSGEVDAAEKAMIRSAMLLDQRSVGEIMTPRTDVIGIEVRADHAEVRGAVVAAAHSRIPVYQETLDQVVGMLYAKDLLAVESPVGFDLRNVMRQVSFVPETKDVASCLQEFRHRRVHIAIVLDEYGGTAGLVTIEDIIEELVGEIADEHDEPPHQPIKRIDANIAEVDARARVEEVNEALDIRLPEDESYDTVAGFVLSRLGRIPSAGESFVENNVKVEVLAARARVIDRLRICVLDPRPVE